jgi:hypothetical protein
MKVSLPLIGGMDGLKKMLTSPELSATKEFARWAQCIKEEDTETLLVGNSCLVFLASLSVSI